MIFVVAFPLLYAFGGSFKTINEFLVGGTKIFPEEFQWNNYVRAWNQANFSRYTMNSVLFSLFSVLGTVLTTSMTGYVMSRFNFPGKRILQSTFGIMLCLIGAVTLYPIFLLCNTTAPLPTDRIQILHQMQQNPTFSPVQIRRWYNI